MDDASVWLCVTTCLTPTLEAAPIGWQLFLLGSSQGDSTAFPLCFDTYATRLLAQALRSRDLKVMPIGHSQHWDRQSVRPIDTADDSNRKGRRCQGAFHQVRAKGLLVASWSQ